MKYFGLFYLCYLAYAACSCIKVANLDTLPVNLFNHVLNYTVKPFKTVTFVNKAVLGICKEIHKANYRFFRGKVFDIPELADFQSNHPEMGFIYELRQVPNSIYVFCALMDYLLVKRRFNGLLKPIAKFLYRSFKTDLRNKLSSMSFYDSFDSKLVNFLASVGRFDVVFEIFQNLDHFSKEIDKLSAISFLLSNPKLSARYPNLITKKQVGIKINDCIFDKFVCTNFQSENQDNFFLQMTCDQKVLNLRLNLNDFVICWENIKFADEVSYLNLLKIINELDGEMPIVQHGLIAPLSINPNSVNIKFFLESESFRNSEIINSYEIRLNPQTIIPVLEHAQFLSLQPVLNPKPDIDAIAVLTETEQFEKLCQLYGKSIGDIVRSLLRLDTLQPYDCSDFLDYFKLKLALVHLLKNQGLDLISQFSQHTKLPILQLLKLEFPELIK